MYMQMCERKLKKHVVGLGSTSDPRVCPRAHHLTSFVLAESGTHELNLTKTERAGT